MLFPHSEFDSQDDAILWAMFLLEEGASQVQVIAHSQAGCFYVTGSNTLEDSLPGEYAWGEIVYQAWEVGYMDGTEREPFEGAIGVG